MLRMTLPGLTADAKLAMASPQTPSIAKSGPGVAGSLLLHGLLAFLVLLLMTRTAPPRLQEHVISIDIVRLADETVSPASNSKAPVPSQQSHSIKREASSPKPPEGVAPRKTRPAPPDTLDAKLRDLAHLRQPDSRLPLLDNAAADQDAQSPGAVGDAATYSVKDYVRAQIERRWNLDLATLGKRNFVIPIRVVMKSDGTIVKAEIVDRERSSTDAVYRSVALSARNAILLASPLTLPAGQLAGTVDMTIDLNPRATLR